MAQQRLEFDLRADGTYDVTKAADATGLGGTEDFRLIIADGISEDEVLGKLAQFVTQIRDGQLVRDAAVT